MPSKSIVENTSEPNSHAVPPSAFSSEQWWQAGYYPFPLTDQAGGNASQHRLLDHSAGMARSKNDQSMSSGGDDDDDDEETSKDSDTTGSNSTHRDVSSGQDPTKSQCGTFSISLGSGETFPQHPPPLDLAGHSMGCATTSYPDLYYGGMMGAYGPQPMVPPQFYGMHQPRMPLPLEVAQEPVYVNAKQYRGILRRRQVRAKAELEKKLIRARKQPYLHESRHQHALRRARGTGGRFAKKGEVEASSNQSTEDKSKTSDSGASRSHESHHKNNIGDLNGSGEDREGGRQSNPQWGNMSSDQARKCALAI